LPGCWRWRRKAAHLDPADDPISAAILGGTNPQHKIVSGLVPTDPTGEV